LLTGRSQARGHAVPANRLAQPFARSQCLAGRELVARHPALQGLELDYRSQAKRQHELSEAVQRRRLDPTLDPADRILAGTSAQGQAALAQALLLPGSL